jgi:hypothetical protein
MKRILLISLLLLAICLTTDAQSSRRRALMAQRASTACATSDTTEPHDTLLEGWQTGAGENTWTNIGDTAKMDIIDTSSLTTGKPAGACDKSFVVTNGTDGVEAFKLWDNGSAIVTSSTALDVVQWVYVHTAPGNNDVFVIATANNNVSTVTASPVFDMLLRNNAGTLEVGVGASAATAIYTNITVSTWTRVQVHVDTLAANSYFTVNSGDQLGFVNVNTSARYFRIGGVSSVDANDTGTYLFDLTCLNTP